MSHLDTSLQESALPWGNIKTMKSCPWFSGIFPSLLKTFSILLKGQQNSLQADTISIILSHQSNILGLDLEHTSMPSRHGNGIYITSGGGGGGGGSSHRPKHVYDTLWYCDHCGFGPLYWDYETHCSHCGRARTSSCRVERVRRRSHVS